MSLENHFDYAPEILDDGADRELPTANLDDASAFDLEASSAPPPPRIVIHYRTSPSALLLFVASVAALGVTLVLSSSRPRMPWESSAAVTAAANARRETTGVPTLTLMKSERFEHEAGLPPDPNLRSIARSFASGGQDFNLSFTLPPIGPVAHIGVLGEMGPAADADRDAKNDAPAAGGPIDPAEVWNDIVKEADARKQQDDEILKFKADRPAKARQEALHQAADFKRQADANRVAFRQALRGVIERSGPKAGMEARRLVEEMHIEVPNDLLSKAKYLKENSAARLGRSDQLDLFRSIGLPESSLLYHLVDLEIKKERIRGGPRTLDEAWARAAKVLLDSPPGPKSQSMTIAKAYLGPNGPARNASRSQR